MLKKPVKMNIKGEWPTEKEGWGGRREEWIIKRYEESLWGMMGILVDYMGINRSELIHRTLYFYDY